MAAGAGSGLTPEQRQALLQALIQGGSEGMTNPAVALQNLLQAPGGQSAAQAIVAGLRGRLLPGGAPGVSAPSPAIHAARGLSGEEPNYAKPDASGILGEPTKPAEKKTDDVSDLAKKLADKTPDKPEPTGNGILNLPDVPDVPAANVSVNRAVAASNIKGNDRDMAIRMMAMEAGGEGPKGLEAVGHVILNRAAVNSPQYGGNTLTGVITAPSQFEPWNTRRKEMMSLSPDSPRYQAAATAFDRVTSGESPDPTGGATHFLNVGTMQGRGGVPSWARGMSNRQVIGNHTFGNPDAYKPAQVAQARGLMADIKGQSDEPGPVRAPAQAADQPLQAPTAPAPGFGGAGRRPVNALIVHHTGGNEQTPEDVQAVYNQRGLAGAHLFMDRQGNVSQTLGFDQAGQHIRNGQGPGRGLSNANTIGIEVSAKDDSDITPEQRASMQKLYPQLQQQFPGLKVFGHGEINPHKQATEGSTIVGELRNMGKPLSEQAAPPMGDRTGPTTQDPDTIDAPDRGPLTLNVTPSGADTPTTDTELGPDMTEMGGGDIGGLLGGIGDLAGGGGEDSGPSQFAQDSAKEDAEPDKPLIPEEDKQPGGILSGENSLIADQDQGRVDLSRMFAPEGMGGTGLFGRDQGPDPSGFKAPVGLPTARPGAAPPGPTVGILAGAPSAGLASITPPSLRSIGPSAAPTPPPRPAIDVNLGVPAPALDAPNIPLPPRRPSGLLTDALPPPRPPGIGGEVPLPPRRPSGLLGSPPGPPAVDPDRFQRDPLAPAPGILGPGMGGPNPPWQDPPKPQGLLGTPAGPEPAKPGAAADDMLAKFAKSSADISGLLGQAAGGSQRKRLAGSSASPPLVPQTPLLTGGLLGNARQGIDLNRFFGLLSGRVG